MTVCASCSRCSGKVCLPARASLTGEPFKFSDRSRDEITWIAGAGPGVLTRYAHGQYTRHPAHAARPKTKSKWTSASRESRKRTIRAERKAGSRFCQMCRACNYATYDPRLNSWVDRWTDTVTLPRLVRLLITRPNGVPWDTIIALGRTPL